MHFQKSAIGFTLAIATLVSAPSTLLAATKLDAIRQSLEISTPQVTMSELTAPLKAVSESPSGQTFFTHPPRLIRAAAIQTGSHTPSTYEFTLTVPGDAGQALKAVTISQVGNLEAISFDASQSQAFTGNRFVRGGEIPLAHIGGTQPSNPSEITIAFEEPVQPGRTVTVAVKSDANPTFGGVYLFGVTAYPVGTDGLGQFLGYGRINFYGSSN